MIRKLLAAFFMPGIIFPVPPGQVADPVGANGLLGLMANVNNYAESLSSVATSSSNAISLIAAGQQIGTGPAGNILSGFTMLNAGATGAVTATLPVTSNIIAALGPVPLDGSYTEPIHIANNTGQTVTLAAGDSNTTFLGSSVIATGNVRKLLLRVLNSSNVSITNVGLWTF